MKSEQDLSVEDAIERGRRWTEAGGDLAQGMRVFDIDEDGENWPALFIGYRHGSPIVVDHDGFIGPCSGGELVPDFRDPGTRGHAEGATILDTRNDDARRLAALIRTREAEVALLDAVASSFKMTWCEECGEWVGFGGMTYPSGDYISSCSDCGTTVDDDVELDEQAVVKLFELLEQREAAGWPS